MCIWVVFVVVCNFGKEWEVSELYTRTPFRAGLEEEIHAHIKVKIGLRSVNITLKGKLKYIGSTVVQNGTVRMLV